MTLRRAARLAPVVFLAMAALFPAVGAARTVDTLNDPKLLAVANGRGYLVRPVEIMLVAAQRNKADATLAQMVDNLIENQVVLVEALKEFRREQLLGTTRVGFTTDIILEDQYSTLLRNHFHQQLEAVVQKQPGGKLDSLFARRIARDDPALKELMTLRDIGEVRLTPKQVELAKQVKVATVRMPDGQQQDITFHEIYVRQHVQGRVRILQDHDYDYFDNQVKSRVDSLFVNWWAATRSGMTPEEITLLRTLLEEKYMREQYMLESGVVSTMHEDTTPALEKLQKEVTKAEILDWYKKHKDEFRQVEKVQARHIRCRTEEECNAARAAVAKGMEFSAAAKKYSIADDRNATPAGGLGWVVRTDNKLGWLGEVALIQHKGEMTRPIRSPGDAQGNAVWEVVLVDDRVEGYSPAGSETVRYLATQEIAKRKAVERFKAMRERAMAAADIRRNARLIEARSEAAR